MKKASKIALGGIVCSVSVLSMFLTGVFPFAEYTLPAIAGVVLVLGVIEIDFKSSLIMYIVVSILSVIITPNKEAALIFIFFLGYYPIIKSKLEKIKNIYLEYLVKFLIFNLSIGVLYYLIINIFKLNQIIESFGNISKFGIIGLIVLANIFFIIFDIAITRLIQIYINLIRPKIIKKNKN